MSILLKKLTLSFLSFLVLFFSIAPYLSAVKAVDSNPPPASPPSSPAPQGTWYNQNFFDWYDKVYNPDTSPSNEIFGERYTAAQVQWVVFGLISFIFNLTGSSDVFSCVLSHKTDLNGCANAIKNVFPSSPASPTSSLQNNQSLLSMVFATDRPFSGISYVKEKIQNFSLVPVAHAQTVGFGYNALQPIQGMWAVSRNIAFGLFVLAAVVFAFMIMFRVKISPQVVISVQSAIPKLVMALILVTFSYAIAGFLIDLMYVVIGLVSVIFASFIPSFLGISLSQSNITSSAIFGLLTQGNPLNVIGVHVSSGIFGILFLMALYIAPLGLVLLMLMLLPVLGSALFAPIAFLAIIPLIILVIVIIISLWIAIKTIWALLKAFVNIILLTIFAPFQIALGTVIPNFGFGQWVKSYVSNLSVFVVTGALYLLSVLFLVQGIYIGLKDVAGDLAAIILNPIVGTISAGTNVYKSYTTFPPLLGSGNAQVVGLLFLGVSFVLFTMIPKATEIIQGFISGKPFAYGSSIGQAVGNIGQVAGTGGAAVEWVAQQRQKQLLDQLYKGKITQAQYDARSGRASSAELLGRQTATAGTTISKVAPRN
jgi:hypothetical protein